MPELSPADFEAWVRDDSVTVGTDDSSAIAERVDESIAAAIPEITADPTLRRDLDERPLVARAGFLRPPDEALRVRPPKQAENLAGDWPGAGWTWVCC